MVEAELLSEFTQIRLACQLIEKHGMLDELLRVEQRRAQFEPGASVKVDLLFGPSMWVDPTETVGIHILA